MFKKILVCILIITILIPLSGCADTEVISELNSISALNAESSVTSNYNLSYTDEQEMIYAQVSNRQLLDLSALSACSDNEIQQVVNYMNLVDNQLTGKVNVNSYQDATTKFLYDGVIEDEAVLDSKMTDYLLAFMQQTPYTWQRTKTTIRGIDPKSRSIIVDVGYTTIGHEKDVMEDSTITRGDPNYQRLMQSRYSKWLNILSMRVNNASSIDLPVCERDFEEYWGDAEEIIKEQRALEPTAAIYETGIQKTYNGLIDSEVEQSGGNMTVRYVLVPNYVLGINLGLTCLHCYITSYNLDNDITEGLTSFTQEGYATVTDSIYSLIYSIFTCIDESDFEGMYKLTNNFDAIDKHYEDVFNSTYQKHEGFSVSLFDIVGTHITCGVTISSKERAKNSNMTLPVYTDRYYMELELVDDTLQVNNMVLLSRRLEGEPAIDEDSVDGSGFSAVIELDNDDKIAVEKLICDFSALQLNADTTSDKFSETVDTSISTNQLSSLKTNMTSLSGVRKVVFLQTYQQGSSSYASVKCREMYQDATNSIVEATSTYEFIRKGGKWYVYNYDVNSSVKLDTTNLVTTGSLCLVSPGKVEAYTSQIKGSTSTNLEEVSDISVSFDHQEYEPVRKEGVAEQGRVLVTGGDITDDYFKMAMRVSSVNIESQAHFEVLAERIGEAYKGTEYENLEDELKEILYSGIAVYVNQVEDRYPDEVTEESVRETEKQKFDGAISAIETLVQTQSDEQVRADLNTMSTVLQNVRVILG